MNLAITTSKVAMNPGGSWNTTNYQEAGVITVSPICQNSNQPNVVQQQVLPSAPIQS
ncbi:hypothetical protein [Paenibacillus sp. E222]|uniref:hypothetical protein n=1 Tax=Paenibacillus sp. E222 TaxID=2748863 RepID=UPI00211C759A|nr:hypothetical protein [Paenibacillus sp. E222]